LSRLSFGRLSFGQKSLNRAFFVKGGPRLKTAGLGVPEGDPRFGSGSAEPGEHLHDDHAAKRTWSIAAHGQQLSR